MNEVLEEANLPELQRVEYGFLASNQVLTKLNLPRRPEFEREIISRNQARKNAIDPTDIAKIDKKNGLTRFEITSAGKLIEKQKEKFLGKKDKEDKDADR